MGKDKIVSASHIMHQDKLQKYHIYKVKKEFLYEFILYIRRHGWMPFQPVIRKNFLSQHSVAIQEKRVKKWLINNLKVYYTAETL